MELLDISNKVILSTPTGATASHIKRSTVYTILGISMGSGLVNTANKTNQRNVLRNKRVLIVDEVRMTSKNLLYRID
jgi:ATP-dependent exoDNAse (exonuclease V) alpha subunit